jgi:hypothetical protein
VAVADVIGSVVIPGLRGACRALREDDIIGAAVLLVVALLFGDTNKRLEIGDPTIGEE